MNKIVYERTLDPKTKLFHIEAPEIAEKRKPGQFVVLRVTSDGERIPLTIADADTNDGTITLVVQGVGKTTKLLNRLHVGDYIHDVVGPLGNPSRIEKFGNVLCIAGGVGVATLYSTAKTLKNVGNHVTTIMGARSKEFVIIENDIREICDEVFVSTEDGTYGRHGKVTDILRELIQDGRHFDYIVSIGPIPMLRTVAEFTRPFNIPTVASLNSIITDGLGMCGGCRAVVDNKQVFVCLEGPEFDAHKVDFRILEQRNRMYEHYTHNAFDHVCNIDRMVEEVRNGSNE